MYVCVCRKISDKDYQNQKALQKRLLEPDYKCGKCLQANTIIIKK